MTTAEKLKDKIANKNANLRAEVAKAQADCPHLRVALDPGFRDYGTYHPIRVCMDCGYEETDGWWCYSENCSHWHQKDYKPTRLENKTGRKITKVSEKQFLSYRIFL